MSNQRQPDNHKPTKTISGKAKRGVLESVRWWWNTRIKSWWTVRLPALLEGSIKSTADKTTDNSVSNNSMPGNSTFAFSNMAPELPEPTTQSVTAILTVYKRGQYLPQQIKALREQSHPPQEIWVWCNSSDELPQDYSALADRVIVSNTNWKFWGRFTLANMARTEFIALFDDDILPQPDWFKHCLATLNSGHNGILGGSGVLLPIEGGYSSKVKVGWNGHHSDDTNEVDLVGHAWFFDKQHLRYMWQEPPLSWENGEDIHFSAMALKHGGVGTFVPPHPANNERVWSCRPDFGKAVGRTSTATFKTAGHHNVRDAVVDHHRKNGWQIVAERL